MLKNILVVKMRTNNIIIETERLLIIPFDLEDSNFIIQLLNDPEWIRCIGDRSKICI